MCGAQEPRIPGADQGGHGRRGDRRALWTRNPYGPLATLIRIATIYLHPEFCDREALQQRAQRDSDPEIRVFKAELRAALRDPAQLPGDELSVNVQYDDGSDEAFLAALWLDLYGDEPSTAAGPDGLDEVLDRHLEEMRHREAEAAAIRAADPDLHEFIE